jgi:sugar lactone lactonase YvrE
MNHKLSSAAGAFLVLAAACFATETKTWLQSDYADFQKGNRNNLSIRSDGRLSLAPKTSEIWDASSAYLWALARDSHGNLYAAGGPGARLYRIPVNGKPGKIADFDALEIHAIAIDSHNGDSHDRVYAATAPDGRIYRVTVDPEGAGKAEEFYNPKQKYIWAMACDAAGNLYVATGEHGEVDRVTPDGKGEVFFRTGETHARSLAFDHEGNLIVGTEPGGLVIRVTPAGQGFVLYQMPKREVTALAVGRDNQVYAAAVGSRTAPATVAPLIPTPTMATPLTISPAATTAITIKPEIEPVPSTTTAPRTPATIPGGSDVYVIPRKGPPERLWSGSHDVVYALALDRDGRLLIGSGNKGNLYRIETRSLYSTLVTFPVDQVTALLPAADGTLYAATGNVGKVFRVGPGLENEGWIESDVFDSGGYSTWGRLAPSTELHSGRMMFRARSGNLDRPQQNWSEWSQIAEETDGGRITAPPARFIQWKATFNAAPNGASPALDSVETAYLRQNVAPHIEAIEITPFNYKFPVPASPLTLSSAATLTLPPIGAKTSSPRRITGSSITPGMTWAKGFIGARWSASDENGDTLCYSVEIRGSKEHSWKMLKSKTDENYFSFDSTTLADGEYQFRITVSDAPSNTPSDTLTTSEESDPFVIDNTPPAITKLAAAKDVIHWHAADALNIIHKAEFSLDGGDWTIVDPVTKLSDSQALDYELRLEKLTPGEHTIAVRVEDDNDNPAVAKVAWTAP